VCVKLCQSRLRRVCDVRQRRALPIHKTEHRISRSAITHTLVQLQYNINSVYECTGHSKISGPEETTAESTADP
jgi:hypothetical protein